MNHHEVQLPIIRDEFKNLSLRELSLESLNLQQQIEDNSQLDDEDSLDLIFFEYLKEATAEKVDGYCFYADYLQSEIETWKQKKANIIAMCDKVIQLLERRREALERSLLRLHSLTLIDKHLQGKYRAIEIRVNSQPKVEVFVAEENLPEPYRVSVFKADKKAILQASQNGEDVSDFAEISQGFHVRFKTTKSRRKL